MNRAISYTAITVVFLLATSWLIAYGTTVDGRALALVLALSTGASLLLALAGRDPKEPRP